MSVTVMAKAPVRIPSIPNFLFLDGYAYPPGIDTPKIDVADITDEGLRELGAAWIEALIEHADKRRAERDKVKTHAR